MISYNSIVKTTGDIPADFFSLGDQTTWNVTLWKTWVFASDFICTWNVTTGVRALIKSLPVYQVGFSFNCDAFRSHKNIFSIHNHLTFRKEQPSRFDLDPKIKIYDNHHKNINCLGLT